MPSGEHWGLEARMKKLREQGEDTMVLIIYIKSCCQKDKGKIKKRKRVEILTPCGLPVTN